MGPRVCYFYTSYFHWHELSLENLTWIAYVAIVLDEQPKASCSIPWVMKADTDITCPVLPEGPGLYL